MSKNYKIYAAIRSLTRKELRQIKKMLHSGAYTSRGDMKLLFDQLVDLLHKKKLDSPTPEFVFQKLYPGEAFDYLRLRGTMSDLLELIEVYWLNEGTRVDVIQSKLQLCAKYRERNLEKSFKSTIKKLDGLIAAFPYRNTKYYEYALAFNNERLKFGSGSEIEDYQLLKEVSNKEDILYFSKKLKTACAELSFLLVQKSDTKLSTLPLLLSEIDQQKYLAIPAIAIYYYCFCFFTKENDTFYFQKFKKSLNQYRQLFTTEDLAGPYRLAINYCIRKSNEGDSSYVREVWELYKNGLSDGILLVNHQIPRFTFDNALSVGIRLKEYEWAKSFITDQANQLDPLYKDQSITFNLAKLAFEQQQYDQALIYLQQADFKDIRINIVGKILLIKTLYEVNAAEALSAHMDNFRQFIRRKGVSDYHRQNVLNIIKHLKKIISVPQFNKAVLGNLKANIEREKILSERDWLLGKLQGVG